MLKLAYEIRILHGMEDNNNKVEKSTGVLPEENLSDFLYDLLTTVAGQAKTVVCGGNTKGEQVSLLFGKANLIKRLE